MVGNLLYGFTTFSIFFFSLNSDIDILPFSNIVKESSLSATKPKNINLKFKKNWEISMFVIQIFPLQNCSSGLAWSVSSFYRTHP